MGRQNKEVETKEEKQYREAVEQIAGNIEKLATAVRAFSKGRLKRKTLLVLLAHSSGWSQKTVESVLMALENLDQDYLK